MSERNISRRTFYYVKDSCGLAREIRSFLPIAELGPGNWKIENGNAKNRNAARARRAPSPLGRVDSRFSVFEFRISSFGETKPKQSHGLNALIAKEIG
ncbi:MAG: hypothetical protein ACLQOO_03380 [Terriglobia bacterium]